MNRTASRSAMLLRACREKRHLSQSGAAALIGCSQARISRIETGHLTPTLEQAVAIEREFGIAASSWVESIEQERESA